MVGGKWCSAAVGDEAGAVCLGEPGCNPLLGISRYCRKEHGGRVEQGRMGRAWQTAWERRAKKITGRISEQSEAGSLGGGSVTW